MGGADSIRAHIDSLVDTVSVVCVCVCVCVCLSVCVCT